MGQSPKSLFAVAAFIVLAAVAYDLLWGYWRPWPQFELGPVAAGRRVLLLKLPPAGLLTRLLARNALVTLAVGQSAVPGKPKDALTVAPPDKPLPPAFIRLDGVPVLAKHCKPADCYIAVAVPKDKIEAFMQAPDMVWIWLEQPAP